MLSCAEPSVGHLSLLFSSHTCAAEVSRQRLLGGCGMTFTRSMCTVAGCTAMLEGRAVRTRSAPSPHHASAGQLL